MEIDAPGGFLNCVPGVRVTPGAPHARTGKLTALNSAGHLPRHRCRARDVTIFE